MGRTATFQNACTPSKQASRSDLGAGSGPGHKTHRSQPPLPSPAASAPICSRSAPRRRHAMPAPAASRRSISLAGSSGPPMTTEFQPNASTAEPAPVRLCGWVRAAGRQVKRLGGDGLQALSLSCHSSSCGLSPCYHDKAAGACVVGASWAEACVAGNGNAALASMGDPADMPAHANSNSSRACEKR